MFATKHKQSADYTKYLQKIHCFFNTLVKHRRANFSGTLYKRQNSHFLPMQKHKKRHSRRFCISRKSFLVRHQCRNRLFLVNTADGFTQKLGNANAPNLLTFTCIIAFRNRIGNHQLFQNRSLDIFHRRAR